MISNRHAPVSRVLSRVAALALLPLLAIACASTPVPQPRVVYEDYRVGAPDSLTITVLPEPTIAEAVVVRPDGKITIQLIGDVQAAGRTPSEIGAEIEKRLSRFKRGARATVAVSGATSSSITVLGEVRGPGTFPMLKQTRVVEAIGGAGGTTHFANLDGIHVVTWARSGGATCRRTSNCARATSSTCRPTCWRGSATRSRRCSSRSSRCWVLLGPPVGLRWFDRP